MIRIPKNLQRLSRYSPGPALQRGRDGVGSNPARGTHHHLDTGREDAAMPPRTRVTTSSNGKHWWFIWKCDCGRRSPGGWADQKKAIAGKRAHEAKHAANPRY
ncbi:hypothetical protein GCM10010422_17390 [Streptomyces graminearus]|uniref:Uncharacterized protein n=1 Tax=Streptomyces graminearus TaxID=284030 RepID=A0ABP5Y4C4_9ACTN